MNDSILAFSAPAVKYSAAAVTADILTRETFRADDYALLYDWQ